nr:HAD hydrolase-like protein [Clostridium botulinum]
MRDREHDIIGAKEFNIDSIGVLYGYGNYDELKKAGATYIVKDLKELLTILKI